MTDLEHDEAISFVAPSNDLGVRRVLEHSFIVLENLLQAVAAGLTCKVCGPGAL